MSEISITVIVPSFNHEKYIKTCILSILNQSYKNFKLIVIDDGSTDNSVEILKTLSIKYDFRLIIQNNLGLARTFNNAICEYVDTEFVTFCASDDFWEKDKLLLQYNFMKENPDCLMCYGKMYIVDEFGKIHKSSNYHKNFKGGKIFDSLLLLKLHLPVTYFFRTITFEKVGLYDINIFAEDYDMNLRIANISEIGFIDKYLANYRINDIKYKLKNFDRVVESHLLTLEKFKDHKLYQKAKNRILLNRAYAYSIFKSKKIDAIHILFQNLENLFTMSFIKSIYNLMFHWKNLN